MQVQKHQCSQDLWKQQYVPSMFKYTSPVPEPFLLMLFKCIPTSLCTQIVQIQVHVQQQHSHSGEKTLYTILPSAPCSTVHFRSGVSIFCCFATPYPQHLLCSTTKTLGFFLGTGTCHWYNILLHCKHFGSANNYPLVGTGCVCFRRIWSVEYFSHCSRQLQTGMQDVHTKCNHEGKSINPWQLSNISICRIVNCISKRCLELFLDTRCRDNWFTERNCRQTPWCMIKIATSWICIIWTQA